LAEWVDFADFVRVGLTAFGRISHLAAAAVTEHVVPNLHVLDKIASEKHCICRSHVYPKFQDVMIVITK
jgi:hypothetical protein